MQHIEAARRGGAFEVARLVCPDEGGALQRRQGLRRVDIGRLQRVVPENVADDAGLAGRLAFAGVK